MFIHHTNDAFPAEACKWNGARDDVVLPHVPLMGAAQTPFLPMFTNGTGKTPVPTSPL